MRVIAGTAKGRKLRTLEGEQTRPTAAPVKEAIFNIIQFDIEGRRVLDLFAGSGQLGLEALSRGAQEAVFVDMSAKACEVIRQNLGHCGFDGKSRVSAGEAVAFVSSCAERFDVILLDPPYGTRLSAKVLEAIMTFDICREGGIIVCEYGRDDVLPAPLPPYEAGKIYRYGRTRVAVLHRRGQV